MESKRVLFVAPFGKRQDTVHTVFYPAPRGLQEATGNEKPNPQILHKKGVNSDQGYTKCCIMLHLFFCLKEQFVKVRVLIPGDSRRDQTWSPTKLEVTFPTFDFGSRELTIPKTSQTRRITSEMFFLVWMVHFQTPQGSVPKWPGGR